LGNTREKKYSLCIGEAGKGKLVKKGRKIETRRFFTNGNSNTCSRIDGRKERGEFDAMEG